MGEEILKHIEAINRWLEQIGRISNPPPGLSTEERKQLLAVNKAVDQLQRTGVPVPEDLRSLKLKLSARDVSGSGNREIETSIIKTEKLIQALGKTVKAARAIQNRLKSSAKVGGAKKYYGVSLLDLLHAGMISTEDHLELQWLKEGPVLKGKLKADGTVTVKTLDGWQPYNSLSTAASRIAGRSLNGWKHWYRLNDDGTITSLEAIRSQYISKEGDG